MSFHYWRNHGRSEKTEFVALAGGYHGETVGALAVTDVAIFRDAYAPLIRTAATVPSPDARQAETAKRAADVARRAAAALERHLEQNGERIAALIVEPLIQCASGMAMYDPEYLRLARAVVRPLRGAPDLRRDRRRLRPHRHLLRARAGRHQAGFPVPVERHLRRLPAAVGGADHRRRLSAFYDDATARGFLHSHSYTGNALACRAALATLDIFESDEVLERQPGARRPARIAAAAARRAPAGPPFPPSRHDPGVRRRHRCREFSQFRPPLLPRGAGPRTAAAPDGQHRLFDAALHPRRRTTRPSSPATPARRAGSSDWQ